MKKKNTIMLLLSLAVFISLLPGCKTLDSVTMQSAPFKTVYGQGEDLDLTGLIVMGTYSDDSYRQVQVSPANISGYDKHRPGMQNLIINLKGNTLYFSVEVKPLLSLTVTRPPAKTVYRQGEAKTPDLTGILVTARWEGLNDGYFPLESLTVSSSFNSSIPGTYSIKLVSDGAAAEVEVQVKALRSLAITKQPTKILYKLHEALDLTGLELTGTWEDIGNSIIPLNSVSVSDFDNTATGAQNIILTYEGVSANIRVTVRPLQSLVITRAPAKTAYREGENLDLTGLVLTGTWEGIGSGPVTIDASNISGFDKTKLGTQSVIITAEGKAVAFTVTVTGLSYIAIQRLPDKRIYTPGENLDVSGIAVTGIYSDNSSEPIPLRQLTISGFDSNRPGDQTLVVSYNGRTASFTVTVAQPLKVQ
jgi:hypothetical protein